MSQTLCRMNKNSLKIEDRKLVPSHVGPPPSSVPFSTPFLGRDHTTLKASHVEQNWTNAHTSILQGNAFVQYCLITYLTLLYNQKTQILLF